MKIKNPLTIKKEITTIKPQETLLESYVKHDETFDLKNIDTDVNIKYLEQKKKFLQG